MNNEIYSAKLLEKKAWIVAVNMGYGHQRTAYPLKQLAFLGEIINVNNYESMPDADKRIWELTRSFYEFISRFKKIPLIGDAVFSIYDKFQKIPSFYPKRDLSKPTLSLKKIYSLIKNGWGRDLISKLKGNNLPLITTFFTPAFMAEVFNYPEDIYCIVCDADIARNWAPLNPGKSRIKYLVPNSWTVERLKLYGVKKENIFFTGYPLPLENIGSEKMEILRKDLSHRLLNLDPERRYYQQYKNLVEQNIGNLPSEQYHILTLLFSIGGAGAQKEIVLEFIKSFAKKIKNEEIKIIISTGTRSEIRDYFINEIRDLKLWDNLNLNIEIIFAQEIGEYFKKFNLALRETDILWTKPSELSFYAGLGIPIIIAPTIGSQEDYNKKWLLRLGAGILQENPKYARQWFFNYLNSGRFAEAAIHGFIEIEKLGVYNISKICFS